MKYLIIDVGNTNIVYAIYSDNKIIKKWRSSTDIKRTKDEYSFWLKSSVGTNHKFKDIIIGSVVPDIINELKSAILSFFKIKALVINEDIKVKFPSDLENPSEVGTDRIVNALCAWKIYKMPSVIIDFGTATTFDIVGKNGVYLGGVIAPGVNLSVNALHSAAARLPRIAITKVDNIIGKSTVSAMSAGIYWGYIGLIKNILYKIEEELQYKMKVIATGGLSQLYVKEVSKKIVINTDLTLNGLYLAYKEGKKR